MGWEKVSNSRWERPMDGVEGYLKVVADTAARLADGREHYIECSKVKLEINTPDVEAALKHAWKQIRFEQPHIATSADGLKMIYEVPDEEGLAEWLASTFITSPASNADELYQSIKPIKQATLYYLPSTSELILRAPHHIIDGTGVLMFWHAYLSALASPKMDIEFKDEPARLSPLFEEVLGFPAAPTQELSSKAMEAFMGWATYVPGIGPISQLGAAPSGQIHNTEVVFSTKTTEALIKACKARGITVTTAVHAAYISAVVKYADPESKLSHYATANEFNLRQYLPEPFNSTSYAVATYYTPFPYKVDLPASYSELSESLHDHYRSAFKENPNRAETLELRAHYSRILCGAVQTPEFIANPMSKDAYVSSLGVVDRYIQREYGDIKVKDFKFGVDIVMGTPMFFIYTFQDQLRLVYSFNDGFEKPTDIDTYLKEIQSILAEELQL